MMDFGFLFLVSFTVFSFAVVWLLDRWMLKKGQ
jgi:hypothetical protein